MVDKVLVLLTPLVEALLQFLVGNVLVVTLPVDGERSAAGSLPKVMQVRDDVEAKGAAIAARVGNAVAEPHVADGIVILVHGAPGKPVLGRDVAVAEEDGGQARDGVVAVGDAPLAAGLAGHPVGEVVVADARRAEGVDIGGDALAAQVGAREGRDGAAERVAGDDDLVVAVGGAGGVDAAGGGVGDLLPGLGEAGVDFALADEVARLPREEEVGDEVAEVVAAAQGEDDFAAGVVDGDVAADARPRAAARVSVGMLNRLECETLMALRDGAEPDGESLQEGG